jgi:hypothetical protein
MLLQELVGEIGAGFESQTLRQDQGVVAVEQDVLDLDEGSLSVSVRSHRRTKKDQEDGHDHRTANTRERRPIDKRL